jgi:uncharacterized protein YydD (DUF2326 family)
MKLSQIYSNASSFKDIEFSSGINIVIGKVTKKYDLTKDSHNLGKSTLIAVLDFMLLKQIDNKHIFKKFETKFRGVVLYLEILLNSGEYLTIRRSIDEPNKISFKKNNQKTRLSDDSVWDITDMGLSPSVKTLNDYLNFDVLTSWSYRKSISYFLRNQNDYNDVFQLGKFQNGKHIDWKPFMFDLLGFSGKLLIKKYNFDSQIENQTKFISNIKSEFSVDEGEIDRIKGRIALKYSELEETKKQIDSFNFYKQERSLNKDLIDNIESSIAELNSLEYSLSYELDKAQRSISNSVSFDLEQLKEIYSDVEVYFPQSLTKDYTELIQFNNDITKERNKYLKERIEAITEELQSVRQKLQELNMQRNETLDVLQSRDSFKKFKTYQVNLARLEGEISKLEEQLKSIDKIANLKDIVSEINNKLEATIKEINDNLKYQDNPINGEIKKIFNNVFRTVFNVEALLYVMQNTNGNVEFKTDVAESSRITAESNGNTYRKMLCVAFDVAVLIAYREFSFYRFVYHDGVLEGLDNRKKKKFIDLMQEYCKVYDIQYIFTSIEDDLPVEILETFTTEEKCLILDDSGDEGKLFGFSF